MRTRTFDSGTGPVSVPSPAPISGDLRPFVPGPGPVRDIPLVPTSGATTGRLHFENWDRLRVFAALDTVGLHLTEQHTLLGFGLPLFLMLSIALGVSRREPPDTRHFLRRRFERVILPWAFWALVFACLRSLSHALNGKPPLGWFEWPMLFYGPRIHLWFLPAVIVAGFVAHLVHKATHQWSPRWVAAAGFALGVALLPVAPRNVLSWPYEQWLFMVPAIPLGFALGRLVATETHIHGVRRTLGLALVWVGITAFLIAMTVPGAKFYSFRFFGGLALLVGAVWLPNRRGVLTGRLVPLMLGVYILHPAVYGWVLTGPLKRAHLDDSRTVVIGIGFAAALAVTALLRRVPGLRRFL